MLSLRGYSSTRSMDVQVQDDVVGWGNPSRETASTETTTNAESRHIDNTFSNQDGVQRSSKFAYHQKITLFSVCLAVFAIRLSFSIMAVFFPPEVSQKRAKRSFKFTQSMVMV